MSRAADWSRSRLLSLALMVVGSLLVAWGLTASAVGDAPPPASTTTTGDVVASPDAGTTTQPTPTTGSTAVQPTPAPPATASAAQPNPAPVSVHVSRATASATDSVSIVDFAFSPKSITVHSGDTVHWTNTGTAPEGHNVTGNGFNSPHLPPGAGYSHTFTSPGTVSYVCTIHPDMKATVQVLARASSASGGGGGSGGGSNGSGGGGSASSGSSGTSTTSTTGAGSESAAASSPGAAGTSSSLPSTGSDSLSLATIGLLLIGLGAGLRLFGAAQSARRRL